MLKRGPSNYNSSLCQFLLVNITKIDSAAESLNVIPPTNYFRQCHSESFLCPLHT